MEVDDLHLYLKCHSSRGVSQNFASKKQLPGFYISGTLVENGLNTAAETPISFSWLNRTTESV